ncbi:MAG: NAD(P)-binding protein, partial [Steroidobacteraceae bacterium]
MTKTYRLTEPVDFAIVGSGAAGGVLARELSQAGFSVVVLEQGPRFTLADFQHDERSRLGSIAGTGFADWPISYAELEPYYTRVEWEIGVSGLAGSSPFDPPRSKPYPMPPLPVKSSGVLLERGARKLGLHPFPAPLAINSQHYRGRPACVHCGFCHGFACEVGAKASSLTTTIPEAEATGCCEVRSESYVVEGRLGHARDAHHVPGSSGRSRDRALHAG